MPKVPARPEQEICIISNTNMQCFDPRISRDTYQKPITKNYICTNASDNETQEEYIKFLLSLLRP